MKVALYYPWIYLTSGAERTILEMSRRSRHAFTLFTNNFDREHTFPELQQQNVVELSGIPVERKVGSVAQAMWRVLRQPLPLDDFDVLLVVCEGVGDLVMFRNSRIPAVCVCLTPLRIAFDEVYRQQALKQRSRLETLAIQAGSSVFRQIDRLAWRRYKRIICISGEAKKRAVAGRLASEDQIEVAYPGRGFAPPYPSRTFEPFVLLPGRIMWTKNIELGIEAFQKFQKSSSDFAHFKLVIAGIVDKKSEPYFARLQQAAAGNPNITFKVFPSDAELAELYRNCYMVLFTSLNEDWGIVPIEAMSFGKPVIAVNSGGPRESVVHGANGFLEEPLPEAFAARMAELARDSFQAFSMGLNGFGRARSYSWDTFCHAVDDAVDQAACSRASAVVRRIPARQCEL